MEMDKVSDSFGKKSLISAAICSLLWMMACTGYRTKDFPPYRNPNLSIEQRVKDLVSRMTLEEKISQMRYDAPAIEHLGIPEYNWWNECLHGVARAGRATVFPQAIGLAATWDTNLIDSVAAAISDEARAKHHEYIRKDKRGIYQGLTFWSPNINLFRDPRWGRGMETYGEDPYLTGQMGISFIKGLQGDDPKYLKTVATVKHYAVHSGPEPDRHSFDARIDERDLYAYYLPHFRACIREGGANSVMCAYNRYMGDPCCGSSVLLNDILRKEWNFDGYVVSDCWAIMDFYQYHKVVSTSEEAGALALRSGTDLNCGVVYQKLFSAIEQGLITEEDINISVKRLFKARFKLGMFDPPARVPYARIPYSVNDCQGHRELALEAARKSLVLLKNENDLLPLKKDIASIAVIGPNGDDVEVLLGNYNGFPSDPITPLRGIREKVASATRVFYATGCELAEHVPLLQVIPAAALCSYVDGRKVNGLLGAYFDNRELKGEPLFTRVDEEVNFQWWESGPDSSMDGDNFGVRWTGELAPPVTGEYQIGGYGQSGFRIFLNRTCRSRSTETGSHPD
jgi:beta-glucosidase